MGLGLLQEIEKSLATPAKYNQIVANPWVGTGFDELNMSVNWFTKGSTSLCFGLFNTHPNALVDSAGKRQTHALESTIPQVCEFWVSPAILTEHKDEAEKTRCSVSCGPRFGVQV